MGGDGEKAKDVISEPDLLRQMRAQKMFGSSNGVSNLMQDYSSGKTSLADALSQGKTLAGQASDDLATRRQAAIKAIQDKIPEAAFHGNRANYERTLKVKGDEAGAAFDAANPGMGEGGSQQELINQLASNPLSGSKLATEQVQSNPILGQLFGKGGAMERANTEEQGLASRGFSMQPEDYEAYGQASGNVTRMFGNQEQAIGNALARRGLSAAPSGAANSAMSGMMGNKYEHLAQLQRGIANDRMQMNQQRLNATRNYMQSLGSQAEGAIGNQFNRNQTGISNEYAQKAGTTGQQMASQQAQQNQLNTGFEQQQETKGPGLGDILGTAAGIGVGALTGGAGSAIGKNIGNAVGGLFGGKSSTPETNPYLDPANWGGKK